MTRKKEIKQSPEVQFVEISGISFIIKMRVHKPPCLPYRCIIILINVPTRESLTNWDEQGF